jgi:hypothetical protein
MQLKKNCIFQNERNTIISRSQGIRLIRYNLEPVATLRRKSFM